MYRLLLWPVLAPSFLFGVGIGAVMPVMVVAAIEVGASKALASAIIALAGAAALVSTVPVGTLIDRVGDKRSMALATLLAAVTLGISVYALAIPTTLSLALFIGAALLRAPAMVAWNLARQAVVADTVPPTQRGRAMTALGGTMRAGNLVGPLLGSLLLLVFPLWSVFAFCSLTALVATGLLFVKRLNRDFDSLTTRNREAITEDEEAVGVRWTAVTLAGIAVATLGVARVGQPILLALWGLHLGWSAAQISFLVAVGAAIELCLMIPGGYLKDRLGRTPVLATCLAIYGAGFVLIALWPTSIGFIVAVSIMSIGNGFGAGIFMTIGADLSPARGRARFLSIWSLYSQGGTLGGPLAISGLLLVASLPVAVVAVGATAMAGALWSIAVAPITRLPGRVPR
ncbi:MAG: MFS transporter [Dermabacter sp.]|nr:MFS transporter [Dermabacter sp.]